MDLLLLPPEILWMIFSMLPTWQPMQLLRLSKKWQAHQNTSRYMTYRRRYRYRYLRPGRGTINAITDGLDLVQNVDVYNGKTDMQRMLLAAKTGRVDLVNIYANDMPYNHMVYAATRALKRGYVNVARLIFLGLDAMYSISISEKVMEYTCVDHGYLKSLAILHNNGLTKIRVSSFQTCVHNSIARYVYRYLHPEEYHKMRLEVPKKPTIQTLRVDLMKKPQDDECVRLIPI